MRAIWKGAIAFGLVNVPVKVYSATEDHDISLHQVHNADGGRIRYQRRCEVCSQVIDYSDIEKAFEEDGRTVVLSKEELKAIPAENSHEIEVVQFVPSEQLEPMMFEKSYYLEPDSKSPKAYVLLRRALEDTDRVAIVQFALREKTRLGALRIKDDVLVLQSLLWPDEVREANFPSLEADVRISAQERDMSAALVESMAADFDPASFTDDYQVQLRQLIEAKLEQGESLDTEETFGVEAGEGSKGEVIDLMEALKRSLDRKRGSGSAAGSAGDEAGGDSGGAAGEGEEETKPARKRSTSAPAKSAAAKSADKPPAGKTSSSKSAGDKAGAAKSSEAKGAASKSAGSRSAAAKSTAAKPAAKSAAGKATGTRARKPA
ncbi:Ku protein [Pseudarthrobacter oxydans]|uniref:Non-homologous end joining protein Ku n=1 Tax=Pseudarthrobacter oxydans TaxID=1671 RepID=A0AAW8N9H6_PSEOX|nr:Ku protein [Pseudarthrobacter oxydans]MDV2980037.1 Ku protein [Actinomycetes bacterium ARC8]WHP59900.1 Ku protein [Arthrobacter sp. KFRI-F3372]MDR6791925.1 DNA end-binding protein Ku [Pseudarthrobacter oxydans]MDR7163340.1 DNA end-binding protein Ku [Pseudarthrobacter oxydans]NSX38156.1 Ku protein [Pseudarthrobacter oxydans]